MAKKKDIQQPDIDLIQSEKVDIALIDNNTGQIPGVKKNPREMTEMEFKKLKQSLTKRPEYTAVSELRLFPFQGRFITIGGNMRLQAMKDLGWTKAIGKILPADTPADKLNEWILLDNANYGKWDFDDLANEWEMDFLAEFNIEIPSFGMPADEEEEESETKGKLTLSLTHSQHSLIRDAIETMKQRRPFDCKENDGNRNERSNALYLIVSEWLENN